MVSLSRMESLQRKHSFRFVTVFDLAESILFNVNSSHMKEHRISSRAIIFHDGKLILIRRKWRRKEYWVTPGGGVEGNETLEEAVKRETREEIGIEINVGRFVMELTRESKERISHQKFFLCEYVSGDIGSGTDEKMLASDEKDFYEVVTVPVNQLSKINIVPPQIKKYIVKTFVR